jgi:DNA-binding LacI/PurR family transcriptional regulator
MKAGARPEPGARPTIYDVARRAGVSKSLVSLVLQGSAQVSPARRAAVLTAIEDLGYRPSRAATLLASSRTNTIEVVIDDYRNSSFVGLIHGMQHELTGHGYYLTVTETNLNAHLTAEGMIGLSTHIDGLVIAGEVTPGALRAWSGPTVVAGWRQQVPADADLVANDDELGGRLAAEHLIDLGHREIGHLTGTGGPASHRRVGFEAAMTHARRPVRIAGQNRGTAEEDGYVAAGELLDRHPDITAVFAANDTMALGARAAIRERGLHVPADISLMGYDNTPLARSRYLDFTSVDDRSDVVGATAARALLARIDDPGVEPGRTLVEPRLIMRGTTRVLG